MKSEVFHFLHVAASISMKREGKVIRRKAIVGAISLDKNGVITHAHNGSGSVGCCVKSPKGHAEHRLCAKMRKGVKEVYVGRYTRDSELTLARPCTTCYTALKNKRVEKVYYSIDRNRYGVIDFTREEEWVIERV